MDAILLLPAPRPPVMLAPQTCIEIDEEEEHLAKPLEEEEEGEEDEDADFVWTEGDETDLYCDGDGEDVFRLAGAGPAAVLVEDAVAHALRTGDPIALDAAAISIAADGRGLEGLADAFAPKWRRVAILSGVRAIEVEARLGGRDVLIVGDFLGAALDPGAIRIFGAEDPREPGRLRLDSAPTLDADCEAADPIA